MIGYVDPAVERRHAVVARATVANGMRRLDSASEAAFRGWLVGGGYRPSTIRKVMTDVRTLLERPEHALDPSSEQRAYDYRWAYEAYQEWSAESSLPVPRMPEPTPWHHPRRRNKRWRAGRARRLEAVAIDGEAWRRVRRLVEEDESPAGSVLCVMTRTGMRVGDVLRVQRIALEDALRRPDGIIVARLKGAKDHFICVDPARDAWSRLCAHATARRSRNVAGAVAPRGSRSALPGGPAYKAVVRTWRQHCEQAGVEGRHNLHRIRRTVAVRLRESGATPADVAEALGQSSVRTAERHYLDEFKAGVVAGILQRIA